MKISLDVTTTTTKEVDVKFPVYLEGNNRYYCYFDPIDSSRCIEVEDYTVCKGVSYTEGLNYLQAVIQRNTHIITKELFQNKLVEMLKIINGAVNEMHKVDE